MPAAGPPAAALSTGAPTRGRATPAREQYFALKAQHPDALLLFRMGDFYETFDADAEIASAVLGIALTARPMGGPEGRVPLAGIPFHALERYLDRLLEAGHRVAIAEQVSPPGHGLVERRVVRVVTPGTIDSGALLDARVHNWLVAAQPLDAVHASAGEARWAIAAADVTTGECEAQVVSSTALTGEWARLRPREIVLPAGVDATAAALPDGVLRSERPLAEFSAARARTAWCEHLGVASLDAYGLEGADGVLGVMGALLRYVQERWAAAAPHLRAPRVVRAADVLYLDPQTRRNLDLFARGRTGAMDGSLIGVLDQTATAAGARLLRARLGQPLRRLPEIEARLDSIDALVAAHLPRAAARRALRGIPDLERLLGRVRSGTANARHLVQMRAGLGHIPEVRAAVLAAAEDRRGPLGALAAALGGTEEIAQAIGAALTDDPPADPADAEGQTVRVGCDPALDEWRQLALDGRAALAAFESAERERTGLPVRVGYHRVFGYHLELPRTQSGRVPAEYEPRQSLAQTQRFRTPALAALESRILDAREQLVAGERAVLARLCAQIVEAAPAVLRVADALAQIDVAAALAEVASDRRYVRPVLAADGPLELVECRHPVVEAGLPPGAFVPNDCTLGGASDIVVLTGPNMGGKSTYLRQVALCVLLAQCGSFVPATHARIPLVDRIYSRVGAQDDLAAGQSTFMVEMVETAQIVHEATAQSLVILDEIGRGTSTYDGLAIAQAVLEHLHHRPGGTPHTLFATHYHELTALAGTLPRVENRSVAVAEEPDGVVFLHRIVAGGADRSYGVHVAALAGLPRSVIARAEQRLRELEAGRGIDAGAARATDHARASAPRQLPLTPPAIDPVVEALAALEPDALTPLEALQRLYELRASALRRIGREA